MSSGERCQRVSTRIAQSLSSLSHKSNEQSISQKSTEHCIFKVHDRLRSQNAQAYEPKVLSIGPYHHGKDNLKTTEIEKLRYLQELLHRRREKNADRYIIALTVLEGRARRCYAEEIYANEDDFVEMMCLDGCFVIELLRKLCLRELRSEDDPIFQTDWLLNSVLRDLLLFENQVPFFILVQLFDMTKFPVREENLIHLPGPEDKNLIDLALCVCPYLMSGYGSTVSYDKICADEVIHLLYLVHRGYCSSFEETLDKIKDPIDHVSLEFSKSTKELQETGVKFKGTIKNKSWLHVSFKNGKLNIPR